uniref:Uncharacterized protein n=1 Tax=Anopheles culicifacies TaxID=139723 RepID=A0A182M8W9_9DIPT
MIVNLLPLSAYSTEYIVVPLETVLIGAASNLISCGVVMLTMRGVVGTQLFLMIGCDRSGVLAMFAAGTNALLLVAAPVAVIPLAGRFASDSACIMLEHRLLAQWQLRLLNRFLLNGAGLQHWNRFLRPDGYCRNLTFSAREAVLFDGFGLFVAFEQQGAEGGTTAIGFGAVGVGTLTTGGGKMQGSIE